MTLTISTPDLSAVRRRTGDNSAPYDLTDDDIDAIYASVSEGNLSLDRTTFFVLRERLGLATNAIAVSNPMGGMQRNQKFDQIWRLFKYWGEITGLDVDDFSGSGFAEWSLNSV
jgi:hypothetical protein